MSTFLKKNWLKLILVALVIEIIIFVAWSWQNNTLQNIFLEEQVTEVLNETINQVNEEVSQQIASAPQSLKDELANSRIYFMLAPKGYEYAQSFVFENGRFTDPVTPDENNYDEYYSYSNDGNTMAFFAVPDSSVQGGWGARARLYTSNTSQSRPLLSSATIVDSTDIPYKQHPDVSNAGEVLFIGWEHEGVPNIESAESWSIYKVINGKAEFLTHGFMPKWLNNEEFIFLRNDGLYVANKDMSAMRKIGESDQSPVLSNNRFDISDDGTKLVWSKPYLAQVVVYSMQSDASLVLGKTINAKAFWTLFSPSSNYLIIQTIDRNAKGDEDNPQSGVEFYDMKTFQKITEVEINFEAFNQMYMFISDWVAK